MDIKSVQSNNILNTTNNNQNTDTDKVNSQDKAKVRQDTVSLTYSASRIADLETKAMASKIDNQPRIDQLKQSIQDGTYQINSSSIASKLIQSESLLLGSSISA